MKLHPIPPSAGHILLLLLLLCATCIAPAMAGDRQVSIVEDGVHLLKFDNLPTRLDPHYYDIDTTVNFVVEGNQYYWVRIGSVKAEGLTSVWWSVWVIVMILVSVCVAATFYWDRFIKRFFPQHYANLALAKDSC